MNTLLTLGMIVLNFGLALMVYRLGVSHGVKAAFDYMAKEIAKDLQKSKVASLYSLKDLEKGGNS